MASKKLNKLKIQQFFLDLLEKCDHRKKMLPLKLERSADSENDNLMKQKPPQEPVPEVGKPEL